jgi:hypothetical protein
MSNNISTQKLKYLDKILKYNLYYRTWKCQLFLISDEEIAKIKRRI